jgi:hypothetical protein
MPSSVFSTYSTNTCYHIKYKQIKDYDKISKIHVTSGVVTKLFLSFKKAVLYI